MLHIRSPVDLFGHQLHVRVVKSLDRFNIHHRQERITFHIRVPERDTLTRLDVAGILDKVEHRARPEHTPSAVVMDCATLNASALLIYPGSGVK